MLLKQRRRYIICGIVGAIIKAQNGFTYQAEQAFWEMLYADVLRGDDATGVILVENDTSFTTMKEATSAAWSLPNFEQSTAGKAMFKQGKAMIGHNRKKTIGEHKDENAHPFVVGDTFAMVHNGTLKNHRELANTDVDSEALAITLAPVLNDTVESPFDKEALEKAIGRVNGAFAIAAYNQADNSVYLTRNTERPLSYANIAGGFFWASEAYMLGWILSRNGLTFKGEDLISIPAHSLIRYDLDTNEVTITEYVPKKAIPVLVPTKTGMVTKVTTTHGSTNKGNFPSKNQFKSMKRHFVGKEVEFWIDDYLEKNFPRTVADGETLVTLFGQCDEFLFPHDIRCSYDLSELEPDQLEFMDGFFKGVVVDMVYDRRASSITLLLGFAQLVPKSRTSTKDITNETSVTLH